MLARILHPIRAYRLRCRLARLTLFAGRHAGQRTPIDPRD
jgi:hypothetical protein